jgi:hypothetical protein
MSGIENIVFLQQTMYFLYKLPYCMCTSPNLFVLFIYKSCRTNMVRCCCSVLLLIRIKCIHCKKKLSFFPSPAGMSLTKLSLAGNNLINKSRPGRVWLVTSRLRTGKSTTFLHCILKVETSFPTSY